VGNASALSVGRANQGVTVTGTLTATNLAGTLSTAAQPNVTSVGTLSSLAVSGAASIGGIGVSDGSLSLKRQSDGLSVVDFNIDGVNSVSNLNTAYSTIVFKTENTERMRIFNDNVGIGTSSPAVELDVDGEIRASDGILFGTDTAAANALDDYEEGTWTVVVTDLLGNDATVGSATRSYTKIGNSFIINCSVILSNKGSGGAGAVVYISLPFTPSAGIGNVANYENLSSPAGAIMVQVSGGYVVLLLHNNGNDSGVLTFGELTNTSRLDFVLSGNV
jgi:hypothetical protein